MYLTFIIFKIKVKFYPKTYHKISEGKYVSTISLTLTLDGLGNPRHDPAILSPGKARYPFVGD
jgi:hypothetical protein